MVRDREAQHFLHERAVVEHQVDLLLAADGDVREDHERHFLEAGDVQVEDVQEARDEVELEDRLGNRSLRRSRPRPSW